MSEKRFIVESVMKTNDCNEDKSRIVKVITDKEELYSYEDLYEISDLLDEQQAIIRRDETSIKTMMSNMKKLEEENEQLRKELNDFKPVMFQDIRGTVILYSKGDIDE